MKWLRAAHNRTLILSQIVDTARDSPATDMDRTGPCPSTSLPLDVRAAEVPAFSHENCHKCAVLIVMIAKLATYTAPPRPHVPSE